MTNIRREIYYNTVKNTPYRNGSSAIVCEPISIFFLHLKSSNFCRVPTVKSGNFEIKIWPIKWVTPYQLSVAKLLPGSVETCTIPHFHICWERKAKEPFPWGMYWTKKNFKSFFSPIFGHQRGSFCSSKTIDWRVLSRHFYRYHKIWNPSIICHFIAVYFFGD